MMFATNFIGLLVVAHGLNAATTCQVPEGQNGDCRPITQCPILAKLFDNPPLSPSAAEYLKMANCGFMGVVPKVCCPPPRSSLLPESPTCGQSTQSKIVGGKKTELDEFPWMALLEYEKDDGNRYFDCGGALISKRYVMTAAHCLNTRSKLIHVRLGEHNLDSEIDCITLGNDTDCAPPVVNIPVEETIIHEKYKPNDSNQYHDIALLRLQQEVNITDYVKPVCLPTTPEAIAESLLGDRPYIAGWGITEKMTSSSTKLKVQVPVRNLTDCSDIYRRYNVLNLNLIDGQLCAGGEKGKDSCRGDSGGPLMQVKSDKNKDSYWYAVGVVSFGPSPCGMEHWPGVYTKVAKYVGWIASKLKP